MRTLRNLFENNRAWAEKLAASDPDFVAHRFSSQSPPFLWIGCSDSRVPANEIVGLAPGELFVHRNIANVVPPNDLNCQSVIQYGVEVLKIKHLIVCGHTRCGGVEAALRGTGLGHVNQWLLEIETVSRKHEAILAALPNDDARWSALCVLNVIEQAANVCRSTTVQDAWERGQDVAVHGWLYDIQTGLLRDLGFCVTHPRELDAFHKRAVANLAGTWELATDGF